MSFHPSTEDAEGRLGYVGQHHHSTSGAAGESPPSPPRDPHSPLLASSEAAGGEATAATAARSSFGEALAATNRRKSSGLGRRHILTEIVGNREEREARRIERNVSVAAEEKVLQHQQGRRRSSMVAPPTTITYKMQSRMHRWFFRRRFVGGFVDLMRQFGRAWFQNNTLQMLLVLFTVLSCVSYVVETYYTGDYSSEAKTFAILEYVFAGVFLLEYLMTVSVAPSAIEYMLSREGLVDLLSISPVLPVLINQMAPDSLNNSPAESLLKSLRLLRLLKAARIFRLYKAIQLVGVFDNSATDQLLKLRIIQLGLSLLFLIFMATGVVYAVWVEFPSAFTVDEMTWFDSFYFVVVTLSTVGYGDVSPSIVVSKVLIVAIIVVALTVFPFQISGVVEAALARPPNKQPYDLRFNTYHVVLVGYFRAASLSRILTELFHENHSTRTSQSLLRAVVLSPEAQSEDVKLLLSGAEYRGVVQYYVGNPWSTQDLAAVKTQYANCTFVLDPDQRMSADEVYLTACSVKRFIERAERDPVAWAHVTTISEGLPGRMVVATQTLQSKVQVESLLRRVQRSVGGMQQYTQSMILPAEAAGATTGDAALVMAAMSMKTPPASPSASPCPSRKALADATTFGSGRFVAKGLMGSASHLQPLGERKNTAQLMLVGTGHSNGPGSGFGWPASLLHESDINHVMCVEEMKLGMMAYGTHCKGFLSLATTLLRSNSQGVEADPAVSEGPTWLKEFVSGADFELYNVKDHTNVLQRLRQRHRRAPFGSGDSTAEGMAATINLSPGNNDTKLDFSTAVEVVSRESEGGCVLVGVQVATTSGSPTVLTGGEGAAKNVPNQNENEKEGRSKEGRCPAPGLARTFETLICPDDSFRFDADCVGLYVVARDKMQVLKTLAAIGLRYFGSSNGNGHGMEADELVIQQQGLGEDDLISTTSAPPSSWMGQPTTFLPASYGAQCSALSPSRSLEEGASMSNEQSRRDARQALLASSSAKSFSSPSLSNSPGPSPRPTSSRQRSTDGREDPDTSAESPDEESLQATRTGRLTLSAVLDEGWFNSSPPGDMSGHIVLCGLAENAEYFLAPLRSACTRPIIVVDKDRERFSAVMGRLQSLVSHRPHRAKYTRDIWLQEGSATSMTILQRCGLGRAYCVLYMQRQSGGGDDSESDSGSGSASGSHLEDEKVAGDKTVLLSALRTESVMDQRECFRDVHQVVELRDEANIHFLRQGGDENDNDGLGDVGSSSGGGAGGAELYRWPLYAAGRVMTHSTMDVFAIQTLFNASELRFWEALLRIGRYSKGQVGHRRQGVLELVSIPKSFFADCAKANVEPTYKELSLYLLDIGAVAIGLYRVHESSSASKFPYAFINPDSETVLRQTQRSRGVGERGVAVSEGDSVYVFVNCEPEEETTSQSISAPTSPGERRASPAARLFRDSGTNGIAAAAVGDTAAEVVDTVVDTAAVAAAAAEGDSV